MNEDNISLNNYLMGEIENNKKEIWSKLNNTIKINKIKEYTEEKLKEQFDLSIDEINNTNDYLTNLLEKKIINKNNDVVYNKDEETLTKINHINFNNKTRKFFYKKEKKSSISSTQKKSNKKQQSTSLKNNKVKNNKKN